MLKMYRQQVAAGSTPEFWEHTWDQNELARVLADQRVVENDPVYDLLVEKLRPDGLFLEGGCGQAQWVNYFARRGYRVVGVDFAVRTIEQIRQVAPELDVRVGDITALPFADGEVHSYYSAGVVEHAQTGPEPALREARRVLRRDGWFLCSVPDDSFLRQRLFSAPSTERLDLDPAMTVERVARTAAEPAPPGMEFFQYAFSEDEFRRLLEEAGFVVERTFGYGLIWGLMELPRFQSLYNGAFTAAAGLRARLRPANGGHAAVAPPTASLQSSNNGGGTSWWRRVVFKEERSSWVGPAVDFLCEHCANMRMFVARPRY